MQEYLNILRKTNPFIYGENHYELIITVIKYIKGYITCEQLLNTIGKNNYKTFYILINKLLNTNNEKTKYFIEPPFNEYFDTFHPKCILRGKLINYGIVSDMYNITGPNYMVKAMHCFDSQDFIEITGDFSYFPKGTFLSISDYTKIIINHPEFYNFLYTGIDLPYWIKLIPNKKRDKTIKKILEGKYDNIPNINWISMAFSTKIPEDFIKSINFIIPKEFITLEQIYDRSFGTFEEILKRKLNKK